MSIVVLPKVKGIEFVRLAIAMARPESGDGTAYAAHRWGEKSLAADVLRRGGVDQIMVTKAEVAAGATVSGSWAETLANFDSAATEFFSLVREASLLGRIPGLRRVPLRIRLIGVATGIVGAWVGEGKAKPVGKAAFAAETLPAFKVSALTVVTRELLDAADPAAELTIRNDLVGALTDVIDAGFIDPSNAGTPGLQPASVTNGAPTRASTGDGLADLRELVAAFPGDLSRAVLVGSPNTFATLHDPLILPGLGVRGGEAIGIPAVPSKAAGSTLALIDPDAIAWGEADMSLRTSSEASIEMLDSNLTGDSIGVVPGTAASLVSLWQTNSVAMLTEKAISWQAARPSVATITMVAQS